MGFVHDEDYGSPDFYISDILECADTAQLLAWLDETTAARDDMKAQIEAAVLSQHFDDDWMSRCRNAYAFAGMGCTRLKQRLRKLGVNADLTTDDVVNLRAGLEKVKATLARSQASASFGRHLLAAMRDALPEAAVAAITAEAATRAAAGETEMGIAA